MSARVGGRLSWFVDRAERSDDPARWLWFLVCGVGVALWIGELGLLVYPPGGCPLTPRRRPVFVTDNAARDVETRTVLRTGARSPASVAS